MQDLKLIKNNELGLYDLVVNESQTDFENIEGFETSIICSLFTDKRANASDVPDSIRRRGHISDILTKDSGFQRGSLLWYFEQSKLEQTDLNDMVFYTKNCLQWMIDIGAANTINVNAIKQSSENVLLNIEFISDNNSIGTYTFLWKQTYADNLQNI